MRKFILGFALGVLVSSAGAATAAVMVGHSGYLSGWTVVMNGEEVCHRPFVLAYIKEIDCTKLGDSGL
jgi:hypothetical protein